MIKVYWLLFKFALPVLALLALALCGLVWLLYWIGKGEAP